MTLNHSKPEVGTEPHAGNLFAIRIRKGRKTGFISGTLENIKIVKSQYDALHWERYAADKLADAIEDKLGWDVWLIPAPEGYELERV